MVLLCNRRGVLKNDGFYLTITNENSMYYAAIYLNLLIVRQRSPNSQVIAYLNNLLNSLVFKVLGLKEIGFLFNLAL